MDTTSTTTDNTQPQTPVSTAQGSGVKKKILVVDDEPDARELFAELLKTNPDYEVEVASDGNEALSQSEKFKFDLILLDIVMPNLDGVDTLATLKGDTSKYGTPIVIMLTNIGGDIAIQEAIKLGAIGYKLKIDTEPDELLQTVADALSGKPINGAVNNELKTAPTATPNGSGSMPTLPAEPPASPEQPAA